MRATLQQGKNVAYRQRKHKKMQDGKYSTNLYNQLKQLPTQKAHKLRNDVFKVQNDLQMRNAHLSDFQIKMTRRLLLKLKKDKNFE